MPSGGGGSAPAAGSSGTGTGPSANVFTPQQQPGIDQSLSSILYGLYGPAFNSVPYPITPAAQAQPGVQAATQQEVNNPYAAQAQAQANQYASQGLPIEQQFLSQGIGAADSSVGLNTNIPFLQSLAADPHYQSSVAQLQDNPYYPQTLAGAQQGAGIGQQGATAGAQNSAFLSGQIPQFAQLAGQAASAIPNVQGLAANTAALSPQAAALAGPVAAPMQGLQQAGQSVWNTAQDPQQALYNRTLNQIQQQQNAENAQAGIQATPYGASVTGDATRNFNIDWQNQQLARQAQGAQALGQADTAAAGLGTSAANILTGAGALNQGAGQLYGTGSQMATQAAAALDLGGQAAQNALGIDQNAANLAAGSAALPNQAFQSNLAAQTNAVNQQLDAALTGTQGVEQALGTQGNLISQGQGITNTGLQNMLQQGQAPYNTSIGQAQNAFTGLGNLINYGNQEYVPLQQFVNDAESYLGLGQSASGLSGQLGQLGVNQSTPNFGAIGTGLGVGSNLAFGSQGLTGALGLSPTTGLLGGIGGAGSAASTLGSVPAFAGGDAALAADVAAPDVAGAGAAAAGGGGFDAASLLPATALS